MKMTQFLSVICPLFIIIIGQICAKFNNTLIDSRVIYSRISPPKKLPSTLYPPKLNIVKQKEIKANDNLEVECLGNKPLGWRIYDALANISERINITESVDLDKDFQFSSKLFLFNAQYTDTSLFACFYNGTDVELLPSNPHTMASFYLYVNDNEELFVPIPPYKWFITSSLSSLPLVIPCRPTNSRVNVTLWKNDQEIDMEKDKIEFDPTRGFMIYKPVASEFSYFECRGTIGELKRVVSIIVTIKYDIHYLPQPTIKENNSTFVSLGTTFSLTCEFELDDSSTAADLIWKHPNIQEERIIVPRFRMGKGGKGETTRWTSILEVRDAKMSDEGNYTCEIKVNSKTSEHTVRVLVHENKIDPFINIKSSNIKPVNENKFVKMVFEINTTFNLPELDIVLQKDGVNIVNDKRYNVSDKIIIHNLHQKILSFYNSSRRDSGNYTLMVRSKEIQDTVSVSLYVRVPPLTSFKNIAKFYRVDQQYKFDCIVDGYPHVNISFERRHCDPCTPDDWQKLNETNLTENKELVSETDLSVRYKPRKSLTVFAKQTREYRCIGQNKLGDSNQSIMFIVSDIDDGFGIIPLENTPIQGDNVTLSCLANRVIYSNVTWYSLTSNRETQPLPLGSVVTLMKTPYSYILNLTLPMIAKDFRQTFSCVAEDLYGNETYSLFYNISVQNAVKPKIVSNSERKFNMKNMALVNVVLNCTATGSPRPDIIWFKNGKSFPQSHFLEIIEKGQILRIKLAHKQSVEGTYKCIVRNRIGNETRTFDVFVEEKISITTISLAVILPILLIGLFIACFCFIRRNHLERKEKAELEALSRELFNKGEVHLLNPDLPLDDQVELLPYDHKWEFTKDRLKMGRILGQGAFGRVVKAEAIGLNQEATSTVAVKMLKERANKMQRKALMAELKILIHLGKHLNIVNLLGAVTTNMNKGELLVIVEYCQHGNIRNYLLERKHHFINQLDPETDQIDPKLAVLPESLLQAELTAKRGIVNPIYGQEKMNYADLMQNENSNLDNCDVTTMVPNRPNTSFSFKTANERVSINEDIEISQSITTCDLLCYAFQVARGMQYLSSRKLLHRDLAARNVLLANNNIVKICDFGLAKDCYKCENYKIQGKGPLPIKWMALESLEDRVFTTRSDIWSYGILLWEFFTLGGDPYPGMDLDEDFYKRLKSGYRMDKPDYAPNAVYRVMIQCWDESPKDRPSFEDLGDTFGDLLQAGVKDLYLELDTQYAEMNAINKGTDYLTMSKSDYLNMSSVGSDQNRTVQYDNVSSIKPIDGDPITSKPTEVIPIIQLEPMNVQRHKLEGQPAPETPAPDTRTETDYLLMDGSNGEKSLFSRQRKGNESLRSDTSSGFHSDLDNSGETNPPPSDNMVIEEANVSLEV